MMTNTGETKVGSKLDKFIQVLDVFVVTMAIIMIFIVVEHAY